MTAMLEKRVALITGGSSGIGRAVAEQLMARGAHTVITGRDRDRGMEVQRVLSERGGEARFIRMDASSEASVRDAIEGAITEFGTVDFLLNSAGYEGPLGPITHLSEEDCDQLLAVNIKGPIMAGETHGPAHVASWRRVHRERRFVPGHRSVSSGARVTAPSKTEPQYSSMPAASSVLPHEQGRGLPGLKP